jgi:signal transduction histidine kinase
MSVLAPERFRGANAPFPDARAGASDNQARPGRRRIGLAGPLMSITITGVLLAIAIFCVTRLSISREMALRDKLFAAQTVATVFASDSPDSPPQALSRKILDAVGAKLIVLTYPQRRIVIQDASAPQEADYRFDNTDPSMLEGVRAAFATLFASRGSTLLVTGPGPSPGSRVEVLLDQTPIIDRMWRVTGNFLTLSFIVSAALTLVLWAALWRLVIRPVTRLTDNIIAFGENPQDIGRVASPSGRRDEIGRAEMALTAMQSALIHELSQRKRLAELGLAVARINHDLRNMLATAQLMSDRLATIADPLAQRLAPQLVATLDRAIDFCQSTLTYGAGRERAPLRRAFDLRELVKEIVETSEAAAPGAIAFAIDIPPNFEVVADRDHMRRVLENLARNATQALLHQGEEDRPAAIRFAAIRISDSEALIEVSDSGPGFPRGVEDHMFEPFHGSTRDGGSGLGLAIAGDLVIRNGGAIRLAPREREDFYCGARFLITLPALRGERRASRLAQSA